ncbi:hypothetical protein GUM64_01735 [Stenotrophomonas maltophilia]|nr:hypothetical protein [Stenotrophomonas maltophilia]MCF3454201.1 hypothetical protein [Stenotrophomonas maltophilia]MCF3539642.1 hypothetical protein [Stenotrophomonas maltophilia]
MTEVNGRAGVTAGAGRLPLPHLQQVGERPRAPHQQRQPRHVMGLNRVILRGNQAATNDRVASPCRIYEGALLEEAQQLEGRP